MDGRRMQRANEPSGAPRPGVPGAVRFRDRADAGRRLGAALLAHRGQNALVLGLARGGVAVALEVARALRADLDVLVVKKIGAPGNPELALGAVSAEGTEILNEELVARLRVPEDWLGLELRRGVEEARRREEYLRAHRAALPLGGRTVVVVDDGLATGASLRAALHAARKQHPRRLVAAVPVGPPDACLELAGEADEFLCLQQPRAFRAVGEHYEDFAPVSEEEARALVHDSPPACGPSAG